MKFQSSFLIKIYINGSSKESLSQNVIISKVLDEINFIMNVSDFFEIGNLKLEKNFVPWEAKFTRYQTSLDVPGNKFLMTTVCWHLELEHLVMDRQWYLQIALQKIFLWVCLSICPSRPNGRRWTPHMGYHRLTNFIKNVLDIISLHVLALELIYELISVIFCRGSTITLEKCDMLGTQGPYKGRGLYLAKKLKKP